MFGSIQNLGPCQPNQLRTITLCARQGTATACLVRETCPPSSRVMSISIKQDFRCARSVGPFGPPEQEGVKHMFFLFLENCFSRVAWNLFDVGNPSVPTHLASSFHSVRSSALWRGVKTRPHPVKIKSGRILEKAEKNNVLCAPLQDCSLTRDCFLFSRSHSL